MRRLLLLVCLLLCSDAAGAQSDRPRVSILCVPGLTADDIRRPELESLRKIVPESAVGWMNARTARVQGSNEKDRSDLVIEASAFLTLGAGSRAFATGSAVSSLRPDIDVLRRSNSKLDHWVQIGNLGELLHSAGLRTFLTGNDDTDMPGRAARLLIMDRNGNVDSPESFESATIRDYTSPYSLRSFGTLAVSRILSEVDVNVFGDIARAKRYAPLCLPAVADRHRFEALRRLDGAIKTWWNIDAFPGTLRIILAPSAWSVDSQKDRLAPFLMSGVGVPAGLIISGSTRTEGLVANTDFLQTIAEWLKLKSPKGMIGRPIRSTASAISAEQWAGMHNRWLNTSQRQFAFGGLPSVQFAVVMLCMCGWVLRERLGKRVASLLNGLPFIVLAVPVSTLTLPIIKTTSVWMSATLLATSLGLAVLFGIVRPRNIREFAFCLTVVPPTLIVIDLLTGSHILRLAWMSYSVMEGARYYGVGNEYCGALVGCMLVGVVFLPNHAFRWPACAFLLVGAALIIGHPSFGANIGGMTGALAASIGAGLIWWKGRFRTAEVIGAVAVTTLIFLGFYAFDSMSAGATQSHFARAFASGSGTASIAVRKLSMNFYLLFHSPWSLGLAASIVAIGAIWKGCNSATKKEVLANRQLHGAIYGLAVGAAALFLFNDSGVVAAAECLLISWAGMLIYVGDLRSDGDYPAATKLDKLRA